jgi:hypothetical protein
MKKNKTPLETIPYIGPSIAKNLNDIGINFVEDLKGKDPERLYELSNRKEMRRQDPCLLYTYRYAVYYAEGGKETSKLVWWAWKKRKLR